MQRQVFIIGGDDNCKFVTTNIFSDVAGRHCQCHTVSYSERMYS